MTTYRTPDGYVLDLRPTSDGRFGAHLFFPGGGGGYTERDTEREAIAAMRAVAEEHRRRNRSRAVGPEAADAA